MKMSLACILLFIQLFEAYAELIFRQLTESQSLELSCSPQQEHSTLTGLHLYHRGAQSQTTLLSMAEGGGLKVDTGHRGRLQLGGGLDSVRVNVTLNLLQRSDSGLYTWELSYGVENSSDRIFIGAPKVKARHRHRPQPPVPIYEEMTRKEQSMGVPQNNPEAPSHLEEVNFPVYANPNIRQPQDNYYACPRQLALRA
ncbi:hypothetical protein EYF80_020501 [Liparis tanakae]|uniref:Immunoglobulin V-set domain-containing protein n=1 Tax=Liparis tanakae TaxID=230148 RepID=A0A4Z2HUN5_9TELE|nr:hypothetical protein EYF80_020501 [Liparis tanakae]